jgi:hypothetical protein
MKINEVSDKQTQIDEAVEARRRAHQPLFGIHRSHPKHDDYMESLERLRRTNPSAYEKAMSMD